MPAPQEADIFLIPLLNGEHAVGQVIETEKTPGDTALCLLTFKKLAPTDTPNQLTLSDLVSLVLLPTDPFTSGTWSIIGFETLPDIEQIFELAEAKQNAFEDLTVHDPAIVEAFVNACHGHYPWDAFPEPDFFDRFLVRSTTRPPHARLSADFAK